MFFQVTLRNLTTEEECLFTYEDWLSRTLGPKHTLVSEMAAVVDGEEMVELTEYIINVKTSDVSGRSNPTYPYITVPIHTVQPLHIQYSPYTYIQSIYIQYSPHIYIQYSPYTYRTVPIHIVQSLCIQYSPYTYITIPKHTVQSLYIQYSPYIYIQYSPYTYSTVPIHTVQPLYIHYIQ